MGTAATKKEEAAPWTSMLGVTWKETPINFADAVSVDVSTPTFERSCPKRAPAKEAAASWGYQPSK